MEVTNRKFYNYEDSFNRIDEILNSPASFEEKNIIPSRESLTYNNGFYVQCYAIFVDVRNSSDLPNTYRRPTLAKIYRSYISELVAIMNSFEACKEVNIVGDCVSGIFEAYKKEQVLEIFAASYTINSLVKTLNYKLRKRGYEPITIGIGVSKGRALMVQAGYKGSTIKDVVWMGDVVNHASKLCSEANKNVSYPIVISKGVYDDLYGYKGVHGIDYQGIFRNNNNYFNPYYYGEVIRADMNDWLDNQK